MNKTRPCSCKTCHCRRVHFDNFDVMREHVQVEVPDDYSDDSPAFCSLECMFYYYAEKKENGEGNDHE